MWIPQGRAVWSLLHSSKGEVTVVGTTAETGGGVKSDFGYLLKVEPTGFADRLDVGNEDKSRVKDGP